MKFSSSIHLPANDSTFPEHKGNANQNQDSTSLLLESRTQTTNAGKDVGKKETSYTAGGNAS
jgi:hypothetical protein